MTIRRRRLDAPSSATVLLALLTAAGCGSGSDSPPASFDPVAASRFASAWTITGTCGDGALDPGEACDDGNGLPGDGCSAACVVETDYTCTAGAPITLSNGRFNAQGSSILGATGAAITGWTVQAGNVDLLVPVEPQASWLLTAEGQGMVDLAGNAANGDLRQDLATIAGQSYTLHFAHAARCPGTAACSRRFRVDVVDPTTLPTATTLTTANFVGVGDPQPAWQIGKVFFRASSATTQVRLVATDADTTNGALIDAVTIPASTCYLVPQLACMTPESASGDLSLGGDATIGADSIWATDDLGTQLGAAFSTRTFAPSSFTAVARLRITTNDPTPADGFTLAFQNDPRGAAAVGCPGEGLGYGQQPGCTTPVISPSVAVEIDTWFNAAWDAGYPNPHIAIDTNGNVAHASPAVMPSFPLINAEFTIWVDYSLPDRRLQVFGSPGTAKPASPLLVYTLSPAQAAVFENPFYAGITGSTGGSTSRQEILYYSISTTGIVDDAPVDGKDDRCTVCGNGYVDAVGEECDDGNLTAGDGCSATCTREPGVTCTGVPSVCGARCGDGVVAGAEGCDDGNSSSGDGCSSTCQPEAGWVCSAPPPVDTPLVVGAASCDAPGSAPTFNPVALVAGRYGLFFADGAVQTSATTFQAAIEARASTDGVSWGNTSVVSPEGSSAAVAIGGAMGNRGFFETDGSTSWFFFPDGSCGDDSGTTTWRLRGVSLCEQVPDTTIGAGPSALSNTVDPSFSFSASVVGSTFECRLDGGAFAACSSPWGYAGLSQGAHTFAVRAVNGAATDPTPDGWAWTIDSQVSPPVVAYPADGSQVPGSPTLAGTAEPGAAVSVTDGLLFTCLTAADASGNWSCPSTLGDGDHTVTASQQDLAGNASGTATTTFTVATSLPAVTIESPAAIRAANAAAYHVTGGCDATGGDVTVTVGAKSATAPCVALAFDAALDLAAAPAVPDAPSVPITASQTNVAGTGTAARSTLKDTVVAPPVVTAPATGGLVAANPAVSGTAEPGAAVFVLDGATALCTLAADPLGAWSCGTTLAAGPYSLSVTQTDLAGNPSAAATVDFTVVDPPVVALGAGAAIWSGNAAAYPVSGTCVTLSGPVTVTVGSVSAVAPCAGNAFAATLNVSTLPDAPAVTLTATQSNPAGTGSATQSVAKDTLAAPPAIASPAEGADASLDPVLSGHTEDFATVTVREGAALLCTVTADSRGNWACAAALGPGSHTVTSTMVDAAGNASGAATRTFTVVAAPTVTLTAPGAINAANEAAYAVGGTCSGQGNVAVAVGALAAQSVPCAAGTFTATFDTNALADSANVSVSASQTNVAGTGSATAATWKDTVVAAPAIAFPAAGATVSVTPTFTGTAEAGAAIRVLDGATTVCTTTADGSGNWTCTTSALPLGGPRAFDVFQTDLAGNGSAAATRNLTVSGAVPVVTIDPLSPINLANRTDYSVTGTCTVGGGDVTVRVGTGGAAPNQTVPCSAGGTFATTAPFDVSGVGDNAAVQVRATQGATQVSEYVRKDTAFSTALTIVNPVAGASVATPTSLNGAAESGATVSVTEGGSPVCTATAVGGAWSCTATFAPGPHDLSATQTDLGLNVSAAVTRSFTVVLPPAVALDVPAVINAASAAAYTVSGSCFTGGSTVAITVGSLSAPTPPACAGGLFTTTFSVASLADASSVAVTATQSNAAGTTVATASARKDTVVAAPTLALPASGAVVPPDPTVTGTAEPGATVTVVRAGPVTVCTAVADAAGSWSCATTLAVGSYSLTATQVDTAANASAASPARPFTVEVLPVVTLDPPTTIHSGNAALYPVSGTCTGSAFVSLSVGGVTGTTACSGGLFARTLDVSSVPDDGAVTVSASQSNAAGSDGDSTTVLKDATALPPAIASPAEGVAVPPDPLVSGTGAEPLAAVFVCEAGASPCDAANNLCAAAADGTGAWSCTATLGAGTRSLVAAQRDGYGNESATSAARSFFVGPPQVALGALLAITPANQGDYLVTGTCSIGQGDVAVTVGAGPSASQSVACGVTGTFTTSAFDVSVVADGPAVGVSASQTNAVDVTTATIAVVKDTAAAPPVISSPLEGALVSASVLFSGTAEPGADVTITDGAVGCTATADGAGDWSCSATYTFGFHTVTATQVDPHGNASAASAGRTFEVINLPVVALDAPATINLANVSDYLLTGSCSIGQGDVTVTVGVGPSQTVACSVGGTFATAAFDVSAAADGATVPVGASQTNGSGTGTATGSARKDTVRPAAPAFASPAPSDETSVRPTFTGAAEPDATVFVRDGATLVCSALANGSGTWTCTAGADLAPGAHALSATQTDAAGNPGTATAGLSITVVALPVVALTAPATINSLNDGAYPVSGTCSGTWSVVVDVGGVTGSAPCAGSAFTITLDVTAVPDGAAVPVSVSQTNGAGTGADAGTVLKETIAPAAPTVGSPASGAETSPRPTFTGTGEPGATVAVREGATVVCSAVVDGAGDWSCTAAADLADGAHALSIAQTDANGNPGPAATLSVTVVPVPVVALDGLATVNSLNHDAYAVTGTCSGTWTVDVAVGTASGSAPCAAAAFSVTLDVTGVADGSAVPVTATQTNASGTDSDSTTVLKDSALPAAPTFTAPGADAETTARPTFSGTAEAGAAVTVREGASVVCAAVADGGGAWSCTPTSDLTTGAHGLSATQTDDHGNPGTDAAALTITVVTSPPVVGLSTPATISAANAAAYAVSGSCTGAWAVTVSVGAASGAAPCVAGGFTVTLDATGVGDGPSVAVTATQVNVAGSSVRAATTRKDTVAAAPSILAPAEGATVAPSPSVSGTAEPGASVSVSEGVAPVCIATADGFGNWSCATSLGAGAHTLSAAQTDLAGNASAASSRAFAVDVDVPVVALGPLAVINGANVAAYPVAGACTAGDGDVTVTVGTVGAIVPCSVAGTFGATLDLWSVAESPSVPVDASQTFGGRTGSDRRTTPKDTVAGPPVVASPVEGALAAASPTLAGTAEPHAVLTVTGPASGLGACATPFAADATGAWSCATALSLGAHAVEVTQTDAAGNVGAAAPRTFTVVGVPAVSLDPLPTVYSGNAAAYPVIGRCDATAGSVAVTVGTVSTTAACGSGTFRADVDLSALADGPALDVTVAQTNVSGTATWSRSIAKDTVVAPPAIVFPSAGGSVAPAPVLSGTAEPGATVAVTEGGAPICSASADALGHWSCPTMVSAVGGHTVDAVQTDLAGNGSGVASRSFSVDVALPVVTLAAPAVINAANAAAYPVTGTCTAGDGDVSVTVGSATGNPFTAPCTAGTFAATVSTAGQPDAPSVTVTASQTGAGGTGSAALPTLKDSVAAPPIVTAPAEGADVPDPRPALSGTAEPGALVLILVGGVEVGRTTADSSGDWSVTPSSDLAPGSQTAFVTQLDLAGNTSVAATRGFNVDTGTPPTVTVPAPWAVLDFDRAIDFAGLAPPGAAVTVEVDGNFVGQATADGTGAWTFTLPARSLQAGLHSATATADGLTSAPVPFSVRLPETELAGGGCGCEGGGGSGGWLTLMAVLGVALRRRPRRVNLSA